MKLGHRLQTLVNLIPQNHNVIWDTCCDHGLLGAEILRRQKAGQFNSLMSIHFVDIQPDIINQLTANLERFYPPSQKAPEDASWHTHCLSTEALPLKSVNGPQLVVIAGVGGDLVAQFVKALSTQIDGDNVEFLLCPVRHVAELRQTLNALNFSLVKEILVCENHRFYECLLVKPSSNTKVHRPISLIGNELWEPLASAEQKSKDLETKAIVRAETTVGAETNLREKHYVGAETNVGEEDNMRTELEMEVSVQVEQRKKYCQSMIRHYEAASKNPKKRDFALTLATAYRQKLATLK